jgi:N-acetylmuramoyl-L-alanine amidase
MREINEIIIHCTATNPNWYGDRSVEDVVKEIKRWHVEERNWSDIGYHAIIHRDGSVGYGRPVERSGAHCRGRNKSSIGVSLVGGRGGCADDAFLDNFTPEQETALRELIVEYSAKFPSIKEISGHNSYARKACPCFAVKDWS